MNGLWLRLLLWVRSCICRGPLYGWGFVEHFLDKGQYEPDVAKAEQGACDYAQYPGAFPPAEHLGDAVPGHGEDHEHPNPPGDAGHAFLAEREDQAGYEHGCVDGEVASA